MIDVFNSGKLRGGVTSGRVGTQSSARVFFATPTPKAENNRGYASGYAPMPSLSREGGYAESGTVITGSAPAGVTLRYTTDGSVPTESSKVLGELKITKTTVLKVCAFAEGMLPSDPVSETIYCGESPRYSGGVAFGGSCRPFQRFQGDFGKRAGLCGAVSV